MIPNHRFIKKAIEDILCYKVILEERNNGVVSLFSPIIKMSFSGIADGKFSKFNFWKAIHTGFIHSFKTYEDAKEFSDSIKINKRQKIEVYRAYIPEGTLYWENKKQYASRKLILK